jgi:hypothetical protein
VVSDHRPTVSVVVPAHNAERFLGAALRSAAGQTSPPLELIVVDDGSTDGTERVVREAPATVPVCYRRQDRRGAGLARNLGVSVARGEWVAFLDADDIWYPDKLAVQLDSLSTRAPAEFIYSDLDLVDEAGSLVQKDWLSAESARKPSSWRRLITMIVGDRPFPFPTTVVMKKELIERAGGFNPVFHGKYHEDVEFFARVARIASLHYLPRSLAQRRRHASQSVENAELDRKNWLVCLNCLWQIWSDDPPKQAALGWYFSKHHGDEGKRQLRTGDYRSARRSCRLAFSYRPASLANLRRWGLTYLPGFRDLYALRSARRRRSGGAGTGMGTGTE